MGRYIFAVLIALDILINAMTGGEAYTTLSCRIGENIMGHGWASRIHWPEWLYQHFLNSVFEEIV